MGIIQVIRAISTRLRALMEPVPNRGDELLKSRFGRKEAKD